MENKEEQADGMTPPAGFQSPRSPLLAEPSTEPAAKEHGLASSSRQHGTTGNGVDLGLNDKDLISITPFRSSVHTH